jgi:hypothetical protein
MWWVSCLGLPHTIEFFEKTPVLLLNGLEIFAVNLPEIMYSNLGCSKS